MKSVSEIEKELEEAKKAESAKELEEKQLRQDALKNQRIELRSTCQNLRRLALEEADKQNLDASRNYWAMAERAEHEANLIVLEGEETKGEETIHEENLDEFRQESRTANGWWFLAISILMAYLYWRFGVAIKEAIPEAGTHSLETIIKSFSVMMFMVIIELFLSGLGSIRDNYLHRYADAKKYLTIDIITDFYNATPSTRLWLRFAYFALRFYGACMLATGNLV